MTEAEPAEWELTTDDQRRLWQVIAEESTDPAEAMEAVMHVALHGGSAQPEVEPAPAGPRVPAFNPAQGSSALYGSSAPSPSDEFGFYLLDAMSARPNIAH